MKKLITILCWIFSAHSLVGQEINSGRMEIEMDKRDNMAPFSGKVYIVSLGFDDYSKPNLKGEPIGDQLRFCKSDADNFIKRVKKDSLVKITEDILFDEKASKREVLQKIDEIGRKALPGDAFIFFCSGMGYDGFIVLPNGERLSSAEIFEKSQNLFCSRQLFFLDIMYGDLFINQLRQKLKKAPEESKMNNVNRVILALNVSLESPAEGGGIFTMSYVKNERINIFDIFSDEERMKIFILNEMYKPLSKYRAFNRTSVKIKMFSEREFYTMLEEDMKTLGRSDDLLTQTDSSKTRSGTDSVSTQNDASITSIKKGETLCFIVGCQEFDNYDNLPNTLNDARKVKTILDSNYLTRIIYLENPTYEEFCAKFYSVKDIQFEEGSQFLFYAASHGIKDESNVGQLVLKNSYTKGGATYNYFALPSLKRFVANLKATNTIMLIDICHSGTMFEEGTCTKPAPLSIPKDNAVFTTSFDQKSPAYMNFLNQKTNLFFGSAVDQVASDGATKNSPFATVVINFLVNNQLPVIDSDHLQSEIKNNIMNRGAVSIPMFCSFACKDDGRFLFIKKQKTTKRKGGR